MGGMRPLYATKLFKPPGSPTTGPRVHRTKQEKHDLPPLVIVSHASDILLNEYLYILLHNIVNFQDNVDRKIVLLPFIYVEAS